MRRLLQLRSLISRRPAQYWTMYSSVMQESIDAMLNGAEYDVVILEHSFSAYYRIPRSVFTVLDQHNVESEILRRASLRDRSGARRSLNLLDYWKYRSDEERLCRRADVILAVSKRDRDVMLGWDGASDCHVIPNGVDVQHFSRTAAGDAGELPGSVVFTGPLHYAPNAEAMIYFGTEIWPIVRKRVPEAELTIVGFDPPREIVELGRQSGITLTGFVPDVRSYLARAQVVVAPLRIGGGTRLKILEALAMGRAVVSTSLGCEGLDTLDRRHLLVADQPEEFADSVCQLLTNSTLRAELGRRGRELVETSYDWRAIGAQLEIGLRSWLEADRREQAAPGRPQPRTGESHA